jgi:hypothetical protein
MATGKEQLYVSSGGNGTTISVDEIVALSDGNLPSSLPPSGPANGDLSGSYPAPTISKITNPLSSYGGTPLVDNGVPVTVATQNVANQSANIGSITLFAATKGGMYRLSAYAVETTADAASSTLPSVGVGWTDQNTSTPLLANAVTATNPANAIGAFSSGSQVMYVKAGTNITYQTSSYASGTAGSMKYAVHLKLEFLG